jgi:endonuclease/exonuclease/phosphatase family metal-dependent hydrolase
MEAAEGSFYPKSDSFGKGYEIGVALLSHLPIDALSEAPYPYDTPAMIGGSPKLLQATLNFEGFPIRLWVTHFPSQSAEARIRCAEAIRKLAETDADPSPVFLCGDFNTEPDETPIRIIRGSAFEDPFEILHPGERTPTLPLPSPKRRVDHLLWKPGSPRLVPTFASLLGSQPDEEGYYPSDHCGLMAKFALSEGDNP